MKLNLENYFAEKPFERAGSTWEALGVRTFKKFLPTCGDYFNRLFKTKFIKNSSQGELENFVNFTKGAEQTHLFLGAFIYTPLMTVGLMAGSYSFASSIAVANLLINIYPMMVQRYNRIRATQILKRKTNLEQARYQSCNNKL